MRPLSVLLAIALAAMPAGLNAQTMVCGPNGCTYQRAPVRSFFRPAATVYRAAPASRVYSRPVVVRSGLFGRRVVTRTYSTPVAASYGSSGSTAVQSYGSSGGTARVYSQPAATSYGSSGGYAQPPAASTPPAEVDEDFGSESAASARACPCGPGCQCGPHCECVEMRAQVPTPEPVTEFASLPSTEPVTMLATLPPVGPPALVAMR